MNTVEIERLNENESAALTEAIAILRERISDPLSPITAITVSVFEDFVALNANAFKLSYGPNPQGASACERLHAAFDAIEKAAGQQDSKKARAIQEKEKEIARAKRNLEQLEQERKKLDV